MLVITSDSTAHPALHRGLLAHDGESRLVLTSRVAPVGLDGRAAIRPV